MTRNIAITLLLGTVLALGPFNTARALAAPNIQITEKDVQYQSEDIHVKPGQTIRLINEDPYIHWSQVRKVDSHGIEHQVAHGGTIEAPGSDTQFELTETGHYKLRCILHDGMLLNIHVNR